MNEGGLFGEREGWHLPGFNASSWAARDLSEGLPGGNAGIGFFVTTFDLSFPKNTDVFLSFQFETENTQPYRALLFVNGWNFGKACLRTLIENSRGMDGMKLMVFSFLGAAFGERWPTDKVPSPAWYPGLQWKEVSAYISMSDAVVGSETDMGFTALLRWHSGH